MRTTIRRLGNSQGVTIPRSVLDEAGFSIDSAIEMTVDGFTIVLRKVPQHPRAGWAEAADSIANEPADHDWLESDLDSEARSDIAW